jgi:hypothetical protein
MFEKIKFLKKKISQKKNLFLFRNILFIRIYINFNYIYYFK